MKKIYEWIDGIWQWIAERVFIRFEFDLPIEHIKTLSATSNVVFAMTHVGLIEFLILSSWCRSQGLGAIPIANRKRILFLSNPKYFFQIVFRNRTYAELFVCSHPGPRLLFCPSSERKRLFEPVPVEKLLGETYSLRAHQPETAPIHFVPVFILWRKHVRGATRKPSEYLFGLGSNPNLIGKIWYLARARKDSVVRALADFPALTVGEMSDAPEETESMRLAKATRRKILVLTHQEMRVVLGPRYSSPYSVKETLLKDPEIQAVIEEIAKKEGVDKRKVMSRAYSNLTEIVSNYRYRTIEILYAMLTWVFTRVFDGVSVEEEELARLREVMKTKPVVFVSCHRSHLDYLVIPFVLFSHDMITPHIAAGINLAFWPMGGILRSGGAFFIRRSFRGDALYGTCLRKYVEYLLKNKYNIKFFIEGTRSRSGKMLSPAYGILKMVIQAQKHKVMEDVALIPVSICYDEVPEQGAYSKELGGGQKIQESAKELLRSRDVIMKNIGKVYVRLAPAMSLRDTIKAAEDQNLDDTLMLQKTAFQLCKNINDVSPITTKAVVSSVILAHRMATLSLEEILHVSSILRDYGAAHNFPNSVSDEGFKRSVEQTVRRLHKSGILTVSEAAIPRVYSCEWRKRAVLNFYKNNAIHFFVNPSIALLSFFSNISSLKLGESPADLYRSCMVTALDIRNSLKFEFFFNPRIAFQKEMETTFRYLFGEAPWDGVSSETLAAGLTSRIARWDDLTVYLRLLGDLFESYRTALMYFKESSKTVTEKKALVQKMIKFGEGLSAKGDIAFPESLSIQTYSNVLMLFENMKYISVSDENGKKMIEIPEWTPGMQALLEQWQRYLSVMEVNPSDFLTQHFPTSARLGSSRVLEIPPTTSS